MSNLETKGQAIAEDIWRATASSGERQAKEYIAQQIDTALAEAVAAERQRTIEELAQSFHTDGEYDIAQAVRSFAEGAK